MTGNKTNAGNKQKDIYQMPASIENQVLDDLTPDNWIRDLDHEAAMKTNIKL